MQVGRRVLGAVVSAAVLIGAGLHLSQRRAASQESPSGGASVPFSDIAERAGVQFTLEHASGLLTILQTVGSGGGLVDYDQDGFLDIVLVGENRLALFHNQGNGTFRDATALLPAPQRRFWIGCSSADYDNDGYPDLFLDGYGCAALLHNQRGQRFEDVTGAAGFAAAGAPRQMNTTATWGDFDRDGLADLYLCRYLDFGPNSLQECVHGTMRSTCGPDRYHGQFGSLYRNMGGGCFQDVTRAVGADRVHGKAFSAVFLDYDGDGWQDLYVANDATPGDMLHNIGGRKFDNVGIEAGVAYDADGRLHSAMGTDAGDYDGDGRLDLVVADFVDQPYNVYHNEGRAFTDLGGQLGIANATRPLSGWGTKLFDYDNDGRLDLLFVNGHATDRSSDPPGRPSMHMPMQLFRNEGRYFAPVALGPLGTPIVGKGAAFGDFDNDGYVDALVLNAEGPALLLRNQLGQHSPRRHWLGLKLVGSKSTRQGLGARVILRAGGRTMVAEAQTCGSIYSANDPRLHFGLGDAASVEEIVVRWPSGGRSRLTSMPADRYIEVHEQPSADIRSIARGEEGRWAAVLRNARPAAR